MLHSNSVPEQNVRLNVDQANMMAKFVSKLYLHRLIIK